MPLHSTLTGTELHENKGVSTASDNTVASATTGATVWRKVNSSMIDTTSIFTTNKVVLQAVFDDVSNPSTVYIAIPFACTVTDVNTVLGGAITVANSTVTAKNAAGSSMGTITIPFAGSAAGDMGTLNATSNNTFAADSRMQIDTDGGSTTTQKLYVTVYATVTA